MRSRSTQTATVTLVCWMLLAPGCGSRSGLLDLDPLGAPPPLADAGPPDAGPDATMPDAQMPDADVLEALDPVRHISAGLFHTCAATRNGRSLCWGFNNHGQLGDGTNDNRIVPVPTVGVDNAIEVTAGRSHSCALRRDGSVRCWGANRAGELGAASDAPRHLRAVSVVDERFGIPFQEVSAGGEHTCALNRDMLVMCWGSNEHGQVGPDQQGSYRQAVWTQLESRASQIAAGFEHTCALTAGQVWCWGEAAIERTRPRPDDQIAPPFVPTAVAGLPASVSFIASGDFMSCAIDQPDGSVWCWNFVRDDDQRVRPWTAERVEGIRDAVEISLGHEFGCARSERGRVQCWGNNERGQLGDGGRERRPGIAVEPTGLPPSLLVTAGWRHACALDAQGVVRCWGRNQEGQLGDGLGGEHRRPTIAAVIRD